MRNVYALIRVFKEMLMIIPCGGRTSYPLEILSPSRKIYIVRHSVAMSCGHWHSLPFGCQTLKISSSRKILLMCAPQLYYARVYWQHMSADEFLYV